MLSVVALCTHRIDTCAAKQFSLNQCHTGSPYLTYPLTLRSPNVTWASPAKLTLTFFTVYQLYLNGAAHFEKCKQLLEYQNLLFLTDIWWLKF